MKELITGFKISGIYGRLSIVRKASTGNRRTKQNQITNVSQTFFFYSANRGVTRGLALSFVLRSFISLFSQFRFGRRHCLGLSECPQRKKNKEIIQNKNKQEYESLHMHMHTVDLREFFALFHVEFDLIVFLQFHQIHALPCSMSKNEKCPKSRNVRVSRFSGRRKNNWKCD